MVVSTICCVSLLCCFQSQIKCQSIHTEQRSLSACLQWVWKELMHVQIIVFLLCGYFQRLGQMPCLFCKSVQKQCRLLWWRQSRSIQWEQKEGGGVEPEDINTLSISEKKSRIPAMVMWYLLVSDRLRYFFSNPKDAELTWWGDSNKCKEGWQKVTTSSWC